MTEEELDSEALVFRHIDRVMRTASLDLESMSGSASGQRVMDTETWSHRVLHACEFFHAFLKPSMSDETYAQIEENAKENSGDFNSPFGKVRYGKHLFRQDIEHLHKENMVFQESSDLVIQDKTEGETDSMVETEESDVEEQVIE